MDEKDSTFGRLFREKHFLYKKGHIPLNHGSFGAFPRVVRDEMLRLSEKCEGACDEYIRYDYPEQLNTSRQIIAGLLNVPSSTLVFLPNSTTALNVVLRSLVWQPEDVIITTDITYPGFEKTVSYIVESTPASTEVIDINWPCEDDDLVSKLEQTIKAIRTRGQIPRLAIFDTITSLPAARVPYERLAKKCRDLGVLSFLDGAHGVGLIPIDLGSTQPDFFCSNLHKWLFTPRGSAILYVSNENQSLIRSSLPTSLGYVPVPQPGARKVNNPLPPNKGSAYQALFKFIGTTNNDAYLTIPMAMAFRKDVCGGEDTIMAYSIELARKGGDRVAQILGSEVLDNKSGSLRDCAFANVRLPLDYGDGPGQIPLTEVGKISQFIAEESVKAGTFFAIIHYNGQHWWRISATIMLELADFEQGAEIMKTLCERVRHGEYINGDEETGS